MQKIHSTALTTFAAMSGHVDETYVAARQAAPAHKRDTPGNAASRLYLSLFLTASLMAFVVASGI